MTRSRDEDSRVFEDVVRWRYGILCLVVGGIKMFSAPHERMTRVKISQARKIDFMARDKVHRLYIRCTLKCPLRRSSPTKKKSHPAEFRDFNIAQNLSYYDTHAKMPAPTARIQKPEEVLEEAVAIPLPRKLCILIHSSIC